LGERELRAEDVAYDDQGDADAGGHEQEQQGRQVFSQHGVLSATGLCTALCLLVSGAAVTGRARRVLVPKGGLEPPRPKPLPPQGSASTNSATWAFSCCQPCLGHGRDIVIAISLPAGLPAPLPPARGVMRRAAVPPGRRGPSPPGPGPAPGRRARCPRAPGWPGPRGPAT